MGGARRSRWWSGRRRGGSRRPRRSGGRSGCRRRPRRRSGSKPRAHEVRDRAVEQRPAVPATARLRGEVDRVDLARAVGRRRGLVAARAGIREPHHAAIVIGHHPGAVRVVGAARRERVAPAVRSIVDREAVEDRVRDQAAVGRLPAADVRVGDGRGVVRGGEADRGRRSEPSRESLTRADRRGRGGSRAAPAGRPSAGRRRTTAGSRS